MTETLADQGHIRSVSVVSSAPTDAVAMGSPLDSQPEDHHFAEISWESIWNKSMRRQLVCTFKELPSWRKDNQFILTGYRRLCRSYKGCLLSLMFIHNETGNVYSHLFGAIAFAAVTLTALISTIPKFPTVQVYDFLVIALFVSGGVSCLGCSSLFHLFACHSQQVCVCWNRADYVGIVWLIV